MGTFNKEEYETPQWKHKRAEIIIRDQELCELCGCNCGGLYLRGDEAQEFHKTYNSRLGVFRLRYDKNKRVWEHPNSDYVTLCSLCSSLRYYLKFDIKQINQLVWIDEDEVQKENEPDWDWMSREGDEIMMEGMESDERRGYYDEIGEQSLMLDSEGFPYSAGSGFPQRKVNNFKSCCLLHQDDTIQFIFMSGEEKAGYDVFKMKRSDWLDFVDNTTKSEFSMNINEVYFYIEKGPPEMSVVKTIDYFDEHYRESDQQPKFTPKCYLDAMGDYMAWVQFKWYFENDSVPKITMIEIDHLEYKKFKSEINPSPFIVEISDDIRVTFTKELEMNTGYIIRYNKYGTMFRDTVKHSKNTYANFCCSLRIFNDRVRQNFTPNMRQDMIVAIRSDLQQSRENINLDQIMGT